MTTSECLFNFNEHRSAGQEHKFETYSHRTQKHNYKLVRKQSIKHAHQMQAHHLRSHILSPSYDTRYPHNSQIIDAINTARLPPASRPPLHEMPIQCPAPPTDALDLGLAPTPPRIRKSFEAWKAEFENVFQTACRQSHLAMTARQPENPPQPEVPAMSPANLPGQLVKANTAFADARARTTFDEDSSLQSRFATGPDGTMGFVTHPRYLRRENLTLEQASLLIRKIRSSGFNWGSVHSIPPEQSVHDSGHQQDSFRNNIRSPSSSTHFSARPALHNDDDSVSGAYGSTRRPSSPSPHSSTRPLPWDDGDSVSGGRVYKKRASKSSSSPSPHSSTRPARCDDEDGTEGSSVHSKCGAKSPFSPASRSSTRPSLCDEEDSANSARHMSANAKRRFQSGQVPVLSYAPNVPIYQLDVTDEAESRLLLPTGGKASPSAGRQSGSSLSSQHSPLGVTSTVKNPFNWENIDDSERAGVRSGVVLPDVDIDYQGDEDTSSGAKNAANADSSCERFEDRRSALAQALKLGALSLDAPPRASSRTDNKQAVGQNPLGPFSRRHKRLGPQGLSIGRLGPISESEDSSSGRHRMRPGPPAHRKAPAKPQAPLGSGQGGGSSANNDSTNGWLGEWLGD